MANPLVSIISVVYNQTEVTLQMLASLRKLTYSNIEVIVVDNNSPSEDPGVIEDLFPEVKLIRSAVNLGYAGGNNLGIRQAQGDYLLFLNNDTEVDPGFIEPLLDVFAQNLKAGIASPKIIYFGTGGLIQYAGSSGINPWTGRSKTIGNGETDQGQYDISHATHLADGAAMMVPMRVIKQTGLMPELYFLYYEELDWCEQIKRAGFTCQYVAESVIYHKESISVGKNSVLKTYYMNRNRLLFIRRNMRGLPFWTSLLVFLLLAVPKNSLKFCLQRQWRHLSALWRGLYWQLKAAGVHQNIYLPKQGEAVLG